MRLSLDLCGCICVCVYVCVYVCVCVYFIWRIIALQNFIVFCQVSTWISHSSLDINKDTSLKAGKIITGLENTVQTFALIAIYPKTISDVSGCFDGDMRFCWDLNQQSELKRHCHLLDLHIYRLVNSFTIPQETHPGNHFCWTWIEKALLQQTSILFRKTFIL